MERAQINGILEARASHAPAETAGADLFDLLHETIMIRNMEGRIHYWNRGAEEMYGWTSDEAVGNVSHKLLQTKFPESLTKIESELVGKGQWDGQLIHTKRNGSTIVVESRWVLEQGRQSQAAKIFEINQIRHDILP
jgi:PAS domain S-box-containing protein